HVLVAKPQPDPAPAAEEDDEEQLGEADFQEDDAIQDGPAHKKLEGPSWTVVYSKTKNLLNFPEGRRTRLFSHCTEPILQDMSMKAT
ncbi:hypothetical protein A2U01_0080174, partial [Trifolium medium]|nr:hypothetical protein [Trifolium medium]